MVKVNLKVVEDEILLLEDSSLKADHMDMEGDQLRNSTMMTRELVQSPHHSVRTDCMLSSKWAKAPHLVGPRMTPAKPILEYQTHQVVHHLIPTLTPMQVDRRPHLT